MILETQYSASPRLRWIEACRGIAATAVLSYHIVRHFDKNYGLPVLERIVHFGHAGVDLFFVISGFILLFVHYDEVGRPNGFRRYLERRLTRILPAYWVALAASIALLLAAGHNVSLRDIAWQCVPLPTNNEPIVDVAWTLQFEFVFYAVFAILILNKYAGIVLMFAWLISMIVAAAWKGSIGIPWPIYGEFNMDFFAGMAVAHRLRQGPVVRFRSVIAAGLVLLIVAAIAEDQRWIETYGTLTRLAYGLPSTLIILGAAEASRQTNVPVPRVLQTLGSASYSLYLFHFIVIGLVWKLMLAIGLYPRIDPRFECIVFILVALLTGVVISQLVEHPLMRLSRNVIRKRSLPMVAAIAPRSRLS